MTSGVGGRVRGRSPVAGRAPEHFAIIYLTAAVLYLALVLTGYALLVRWAWP